MLRERDAKARGVGIVPIDQVTLKRLQRREREPRIRELRETQRSSNPLLRHEPRGLKPLEGTKHVRHLAHRRVLRDTLHEERRRGVGRKVHPTRRRGSVTSVTARASVSRAHPRDGGKRAGPHPRSRAHTRSGSHALRRAGGRGQHAVGRSGGALHDDLRRRTGVATHLWRWSSTRGRRAGHGMRRAASRGRPLSAPSGHHQPSASLRRILLLLRRVRLLLGRVLRLRRLLLLLHLRLRRFHARRLVVVRPRALPPAPVVAPGGAPLLARARSARREGGRELE